MHNFMNDQQISEMEERYHSLQKIITNDMQALINEVKAYKELLKDMKEGEGIKQFKNESGVHNGILSEYPSYYLEPVDIQKILGIGKSQTYELVKSGQFPIKKVGRLIRRIHLLSG